jgi:hypothetical protein
MNSSDDDDNNPLLDRAAATVAAKKERPPQRVAAANAQSLSHQLAGLKGARTLRCARHSRFKRRRRLGLR